MARKAKRPGTALAFQDDRALMTPGPVRDRLLDQMAGMGAKWVRANVTYGKTQGGTNLAELDSLVDAARARGLRVQATLMSDPKYAKSTSGLTYKNNDPKLWSQFAKNVADREKGRISRYSVGNEMNYSTFAAGAFEHPRQAGRNYRGIYRAGYGAIKAADPSAQVLAGELTPGGGDPRKFLQGFLGGKPVVTAGLAYHPYEGTTNWDINSLGALQKTLARYKRQGKLQTAKGSAAPLFITEMGYQRGPGQVRKAAAAYSKARAAGAREFLQYQVAPGQSDPGAPAVTDDYGAMVTPGRAPTPAASWDTSVGTAEGDLSGYARALRDASRRRVVRREPRI